MTKTQGARKRRSSRSGGTVTVWRPSVTVAQLSRAEQTRAIADADIGNLYDERGQLRPLETLPPEVACTIASVTRRHSSDGSETVTIRMRDKAAALERLAKEMGLLPSAKKRSS